MQLDMDFGPKLEKLLTGKKRVDVAAAVGIKSATLSKYCSGVMPSVNVAWRLARALNVPLEWLADDNRGLPAPKSHETQLDIRDIPDIELHDEITRRYIKRHTQLLKEADSLARIDWVPLAQRIYTALASGQTPPADAVSLAERAFAFEVDCGQLRVEYDILHKARLYDLAVRGLPFEDCKDYDPEEVEHAIADLRSVEVFENMLDVPMLIDKPDIAKIKAVAGHLEHQQPFNIAEYLAELEAEGRAVDQEKPPAKAAKLRPQNRGKGQAPRSAKRVVDRMLDV